MNTIALSVTTTDVGFVQLKGNRTGNKQFVTKSQNFSPINTSFHYMKALQCVTLGAMYVDIVHIIYVGDGYITRPVLKPPDGFKAGPTAANPGGRLDIRPDGFEAGLMAC